KVPHSTMRDRTGYLLKHIDYLILLPSQKSHRPFTNFQPMPVSITRILYIASIVERVNFSRKHLPQNIFFSFAVTIPRPGWFLEKNRVRSNNPLPQLGSTLRPSWENLGFTN